MTGPEERGPAAMALAREATNTDDRVAARLCQIAAANGRSAILPVLVSVACYAGLLSRVVPSSVLRGWLTAMALLVGARLIVLALHARVESVGRQRWLVLNALSLVGCGLGFGISTQWLEFPQETWVIAVVNLWLGGLACGALLSQGLLRWHGLAFAVPALAPLQIRLLASGDPTLLGLGIGNLVFFAYLFHVVQRSQTHTIGELRHRVAVEAIVERLALEQARSASLVEKLSAEIARRRKTQAALIEARNRARDLSNLDPLTKLANRRVFERVLDREWSRARREQRPLSLVLCDLDRFQAYNERYGHHAGDKCLVRVADVIAGYSRRAGDLVARFGGEQFAVLLPETSELAALDVADSIRAGIHDLTLLHGASDVERVLTASCGSATITPAPGQRPQQLVDAAAHALQRAKRAGRNCVFTVTGTLAQEQEQEQNEEEK
ncbi:MAG: GGDEF domain-containing protein [Gammaproteobacteria bacterium]|nr:GGDEF domain-containing protein [Gammaproteobacteria bacterium]